MNRIRRTLVVAIIGVVMLGFGLIAAVDAVKPPPYEDAIRIHRFVPTTIHESDASFFWNGWVYMVEPGYDETELFPQPIRFQLWIGDYEIKLSRYAVGHGELEETGLFEPWKLPYLVGPLRCWYAYFEPGYFDVGEYQTHIKWTCKDPDSPSNRIVIDYPGVGPLEFWGLLTVQEG